VSSELQAVTAATTEMRASTESVAHGVNAASGEADRAVGATVDELQSSMSVVVEQQTATTGEIARNLIVAADSSTDIAPSAGAVAQAASQSFDSAAEVRLVVGELSRVATELNAGVEEFTPVAR
jgi:methyl-accepting chemotaxis protein